MLLAGLENPLVAIENNHNTQISRPWKSEVCWMLLVALKGWLVALKGWLVARPPQRCP